MINLEKITGSYEMRARLYPSLLCLLPIIIGIFLSFPSLYKTLSGFVALAAAFGMLQLFAHLARDRGKRLERKLFEKWGGMPSVIIFRYSDSSVPTPAKRRYHQIISSKSGINAPTQEFETASPGEADAIYQSWSDYLRAKTRDTTKFPMIFQENINYGFRRNLLGLKWFCISSGVVSLALIAIPIYKSGTYTEIQIGVALAIIAYLLLFVFVINGNWVKVAAYAYARQLIESINT